MTDWTRRATLMALAVASLATAAPAGAQTGNAYGGEGNVLEEVTQTAREPEGTAREEEVQGTPRTEGTPAGAGQAAGGPAAAGAGPVSQVAADDVSSLPFTGVDVLLLVAGGLVLVGVGAGVRRLSATA